jgi:hypothetical protein
MSSLPRVTPRVTLHIFPREALPISQPSQKAPSRDPASQGSTKGLETRKGELKDSRTGRKASPKCSSPTSVPSRSTHDYAPIGELRAPVDKACPATQYVILSMAQLVIVDLSSTILS